MQALLERAAELFYEAVCDLSMKLLNVLGKKSFFRGLVSHAECDIFFTFWDAAALKQIEKEMVKAPATSDPQEQLTRTVLEKSLPRLKQMCADAVLSAG